MEAVTPVDKVLRNAEMRQAIIKLVIHQGGELSLDDLKSCCLVNKDWHASISASLKISKKPLFFLSMGSNSLSPVPRAGYRTNNIGHLYKKTDSAAQFLKHMKDRKSVHRQNGRFPPFALEISASSHSLALTLDIIKYLEKYGDGLVKLIVFAPVEETFTAFDVQNIRLPNLHTITVDLPNKYEGYLHEEQIGAYQSQKVDFQRLIFAILPRCGNLKKFSIRPLHPGFTSTNCVYDIPPGFEGVTFPPLLENLHITGTMQISHLENLSTLSFPKLTDLTLRIPSTQSECELYYKFLENVAPTLRKLQFMELKILNNTVNLKLPGLPKLETFRCSAFHLQLEAGQNNLQECMPLLSNLEWEDQTASVFSKWTNTSAFPTVTHLKFSLIVVFNYELPNFLYYHRVAVDAAIMTRVFSTFPNLTVLQLKTLETDISGLRFAFEHMRQLKSLTVVVATRNEKRYAWDALLLGLSEESAAKLRETPDVWIKSDFEKDAFTSVRNLRELQRLELVTWAASTFYPDYTFSLISDRVFEFGFLKMPKLKSILIERGFRASPKIIDIWRNEGRILEDFAYHRSRF